jgi:hypothetical protein
MQGNLAFSAADAQRSYKGRIKETYNCQIERLVQ